MLRIVNRKALVAKGIVYSNTHLLRLEAKGKFPRRFNISEGRVAWLESEVDQWICDRAAASPARQRKGPTGATV